MSCVHCGRNECICSVHEHLRRQLVEGVRQRTAAEQKVLGDAKDEAVAMSVQQDVVNHPPHYKSGGIETIDFIEAKRLGFNLGNAVKYITRAGKKDPSKYSEDLQKARFYLDREIQKVCT